MLVKLVHCRANATGDLTSILTLVQTIVSVRHTAD